MDLISIAIILGLVEGFTEFLPISSTGHLIVAGHLLNFTGDKAETFEIFIQLGAILAVVILYWKRFILLLPTNKQGKGLTGLPGLIKIGIGCLPAFISGFLLHGIIKSKLFSTSVVAMSLIIGGIILLFIKEKDNSKSDIDEITLKDSFLIGCFQCLSLCPGVSRAGATIVGGMLGGLSKKISAEFSFLLAVPTMAAAVGYDLLKSRELLSMADMQFFAIGFIVSFISAYVVIKSFMLYLQSASFQVFGLYRIIFGILILVIF